MSTGLETMSRMPQSRRPRSGDDVLVDAHVLVDQVQPGLVRLLVSPGGDDDDGGVGKVAVVPGVDLHLSGKGDAVGDVLGLAVRLVLVGVQQNGVGAEEVQVLLGDGGRNQQGEDDGQNQKQRKKTIFFHGKISICMI